MRVLAWWVVCAAMLSACGAQMVVPGDADGGSPGDAILRDVQFPDVPPPPDVPFTDVPPPPRDVPSTDVPMPPDVGFPDVPPPPDVPFADVPPPPPDVPFVDVPPPPPDVPVFDVPPPPPDVPFVDVPPPPDVPVVDVPPPPDVPFMDVPPPPDVPVMDVPPPPDVPTLDVPIDTGPPSLVGNWRLVEYVIHNMDGGTQTLLDTDTTVGGGGFSYQLRTNGMLFLTADRLSENVGFVLNEHFFTDNNQPDFTMSFSVFGFAAPGTLSGSTFTVAGGGTTITFVRNADGTISQTDASSGNTATWARITGPLATGTYAGQGQASLWMPMSSSRFGAARMALAWDAPGFNYVFTNDQPIAFGPFGTALYDLSVTTPPPGTITFLAGTQLALAYVIVYDDVNRNGAFDRGTDTLRGVSPIALAWRTGPASAPFQNSVFRNLDVGFQVVHLQPDYGAGANTTAPFDPTHAVTPDAPVDTGPSPTPIPNML